MFFDIISKMDYSSVVAPRFGKQLVNLLELFTLLSLRFSTRPFWLFYIQGVQIAGNQVIGELSLHGGFVIHVPNLRADSGAHFSDNRLYGIGG